MIFSAKIEKSLRNDLWDHLASTTKTVVMYGMGNGADKILAVCEKYGIDFERIDVGVETVRQVLDEAIRIFNLICNIT